jgi:hypothetical protein
MARHTGPRMVQCYHCRHRFEVGGRAQSTSCPGCNKPLIVGDIQVPGQRGPLREIRTCGRITVKKRGRLIAELIEAHGGIECAGIIDAKKVLCGIGLSLGPKSRFKGQLQTPVLSVKAGARLDSQQIAVPDDPLGLMD